MIDLLEGETIDDLGDGYKIIQSDNSFKFGTDSVLLSNFSNAKNNDIVCDLGTGTAIIPILIAKKSSAKITAIEIDKSVASMANRSVILNGLQEQIKIINQDINSLELENESFSLVTANPPYKKIGTGILNTSEKITTARHEITATLEDFVKTGASLLKYGGRMCIVHKASRLVDVICLFRKYKLEPKRLKIIKSEKKAPSLILIEGKKGAGAEIKIEIN